METLLYFRLRRFPEPWNAHLPKGDEPYHKRKAHWLRHDGKGNAGTNWGHKLPKPRNRKGKRYYNARRAARRASGRGSFF
jgi:hypothetical protein